jgi:putative ABC transport system substrate-binding protein
LYQLPALADELVRLKVDVLVVNSTPGTLAAKNATKTIPIVFSNVADPVAVGLVDSLARLGGNITGFTIITAVLAGKRLELHPRWVGPAQPIDLAIEGCINSAV